MNKKIYLIILIFLNALYAFADHYKITEIKGADYIIINGKRMSVNDTFTDEQSKKIRWDNVKYVKTINIDKGNKIRRFIKDIIMAEKPSAFSDLTNERLAKGSTREANPLKIARAISEGHNKEFYKGKRIALVIGNSNYTELQPLINATYDAYSIKQQLVELGFDVVSCYDGNIIDMKNSLNFFVEKSKGYDVAMFYYSGHGLQDYELNTFYMLPIDLCLSGDNPDYISHRSCLSGLDVRDEMHKIGAKFNLMFFDACRTSYNVRSMKYGDFSMEPGPNTMVVFSTSNGDTAFDEIADNENGPFVTAFKQIITTPNEDLALAIKKIKQRVYELTSGKQQPNCNDNISLPFCFNEASAGMSDKTSSNSTNVIYSLEEALAFFDNNDYDTPFKTFETLAKKGNVIAQSTLGLYYLNGIGGAEFSYCKAVEWFSKAAKNGEASAQFNLGNCYANGYGVKLSYEKAAEWYTKAAEQGDAYIQYLLGFFYEKGRGVEQSYDKAIEWYSKSAEKGCIKAQFHLGVCYENGYGVEQSYKKAVEWFSKAAEQEDASAQFHLGVCYANGRGVEQSYEKAVEWYTKAAEQGNAYAQHNLGNCYADGNGTKQSDKKAVEWYSKAAEQGNSYAQYSLGYFYEKGRGIEQSYKKAAWWYTKAAEQGDAYAQYNLGLLYENGHGIEVSYEKAAECFTKAAEQGFAYAQYNLGFFYEKGRGIEQSYEKAAWWYTKAAEQGDAYAQYKLGIFYANGKGLVQSDEKAVEWYSKAAEQGYAYAQYNLGIYFYYGYGVKQSNEKAIEWWTKAAKQGHQEAKKFIERLM